MNIVDLKFDDRNCNTGTARGRELVRQSLQKYGAGRSILVDKNGKVIAGNKTLEQAIAEGLEIEVLKSDGKKLVAVQRTDLDLDKDQAARELAIADNRTSELGLEWDYDLLAEMPEDFLSEFDFDPNEFMQPNGFDGNTDSDEIPDEVETRCKQGDLWQLGRHRLLCGDATNADDVGRLMEGTKPVLMVTDPPYGVNYDPEWRVKAGVNKSKGRIGKVNNDDRIDWSSAYILSQCQIAYVWHASWHAKEVQQSLEDSNFIIIAQIIWVKDQFILSRGDYHWKHEPCWYAHKKDFNHNWQGARDQCTVWEINRVDKNEEAFGHGTQKPVECMLRPIINNTQKDQKVYDPFLGSGTTLIAAEKTGRICYGMEIDPHYCDVIITRWENFTGQTAELI